MIVHLLQKIKSYVTNGFTRITRNIRIPRLNSLSLTGNNGSSDNSDRTANDSTNAAAVGRGNNEMQPHYVNVLLHRILSTLSSASLTLQSNLYNSKIIILKGIKYSSEKIRKIILYLLRFLLRQP